jgi:hypothetical protein
MESQISDVLRGANNSVGVGADDFEDEFNRLVAEDEVDNYDEHNAINDLVPEIPAAMTLPLIPSTLVTADERSVNKESEEAVMF